MQQPKVSIIIPVYNGEKFLDAAIESAIAQDWEHTEIIVVNDGSTDASERVIESYAGRVSIIHQENGGACRARNEGLRHARGDYIQYLDQDDLLHPQKISTQLQALNGEPKDALACGRVCVFSREMADAQSLAYFDDLQTYNAPVDWLVWSLSGGSLQSSAWLVSRELHEKAGQWNEDLKSNPMDDGELFTRIILASSHVKYTGEAKSYFRFHDESQGHHANTRTKATSLFNSLELCAGYLLKAEYSRRTRHAVACTFKHFAYNQCLSEPDLRDKALARIRQLGFTRVRYDLGGGRIFRLVDKFAGVRAAIKLKALMNSYQRKARKTL